jgi:hypothetical protein
MSTTKNGYFWSLQRHPSCMRSKLRRSSALMTAFWRLEHEKSSHLIAASFSYATLMASVYGPCRGSFLSLWGLSADSSQKVRHVVAGEATSYNNIAPNLFFYKAPETFRLALLTRRRLRASPESSHVLTVRPSTNTQYPNQLSSSFVA